MLLWKICLFGSYLIIAYNYAGYALIALIINKLFPIDRNSTPVQGTENLDFPHITFIVAAYNEASCIRSKIENCLSLNYPPERVEWLFVTDGSTDGTPEIVGSYHEIRLLHRPEREGKSAALHRAVIAATHSIIIASDSNTFLNREALLLISAHYSNPKVGGVAGEKKVLHPVQSAPGSDITPGEGEGLYWKYESALKRIDSAFYSVVGAAGELFSFRKPLYEPVGPEIILDDFMISMRIAAKGFRIIYEPRACAEEAPSFSISDEQKRKIRIGAGGFQSLALLRGTISPLRYTRLYYLYVSHRVLRWTASPFCLLLSFVAGTLLWIYTQQPLFRWLWISQITFLALGLVSPILPKKGPLRALKLPAYFLMMNFSVVQGFVRWIRGRQPAAWEKAKRA